MEGELLKGMDLGIGCDYQLGVIHGSALEHDGSKDVGGGQVVEFGLKVITSSEELAKSLEASSNVSYSGVFSATASAKYFSESAVSKYHTYVVAKCIVKNPVQLLKNPKPKKEVNEWITSNNQSDFDKLYGKYYCSGWVTGGCYFGILEISSTSSEEQKIIAASVSGSGWGFKANASVSERIMKAAEKKEKRITIYKMGGNNEVLPTTVDEMIRDVVTFPSQVKKNPVPILGIYKEYSSSIPFNRPKKYDSNVAALQKRHDDLIELAKRYISLREMRADIMFVIEHFNDYQTGKGVLFSNQKKNNPISALDLNSLKQAVDEVNSHLSLITEAAGKCKEYTDYTIPAPYTLSVNLPTIGGENMQLIEMEKKLVPEGTIVLWSGQVEFIPEGWSLCDGSNGTPDLSGRFVLSYDKNRGESKREINSQGGSETVELKECHLPIHGHKGEGKTTEKGFKKGTNTWRGGGDKSGPYVGDPVDIEISVNIESTGDGIAHDNMPPFYVLAYIMKL
jgi:microcystin-dependent protein